jgi:hypothetical protein
VHQGEIFSKVWEIYEAGGLVAVCAWCFRVRIDEEWVGPAPGVLSTLDGGLMLSHSICPRCADSSPS